MDYSVYLSPFSWRYGSEPMRRLWSEHEKRRLWRELWVALARTQSTYGLVDEAELADLIAHANDIDLERAFQIEAEIHHDLMAELKTYAAQCPTGGGILHLGATSMDIEDNADALRLRRALDLLLAKMSELLAAFAQKIELYADIPMIAFTHLQPAEPSTLGYRLSMYAQDLAEDYLHLIEVRQSIRGKGFKGAVGTAAAYAELIGNDHITEFENRLSELLNLPFFPVATQTYPRKQDYFIIAALAGVGATLYKFAFDLRLLQSPTIGEWSEPFGARQVGSSAMPFKRNPINAEKIDSLARALAQMPAVAWHNAAHTLLERTLDDSANRRTLLPEACLNVDELLKTAIRLVQGLNIHSENMARNLATYAPFAATERVLMAVVQAGADRQIMHERLRDHAMQAWQTVRQGQPNPLADTITQDPEFTRYVSAGELGACMQVDQYVGIAPERARQMALTIHALLEEKIA